MSTTEDRQTKQRPDTIFNGVRKELSKIREANERLNLLSGQLNELNHPAPSDLLDEAVTTINVALNHARNVFASF